MQRTQEAAGAQAASISSAFPSAWIVETFEYRAFEPDEKLQAKDIFAGAVIEPWEPGMAPARESSAPAGGTAPSGDEQTERMDALLQESRQQGYEAGLKQGHEDGRSAAEAEARAVLAEQKRAAGEERRSEFARLVEGFDKAREQYLHAMEPEVVRLALAVAARILRREAQMDPLLLTGAVRVALGQIASSSKVSLKVPPDDLNLWKEAIALLPKLPVRPEIVPGENMRLGDCVIETELGSVDLGVRAQLSEIERGFFDRPGASAARPAHSDGEASEVGE